MNIKEQVLSIEQIKELQELGFDLEKYASMCWAKLFDHNNLYRILNKEYAEYIELNDYIPTLTIGDIMEILPSFIDIPFPAEMKIYPIRYFIYVNKAGVWYYNNDSKSSLISFLISFLKRNIINSLFETLKWGIKEKHIAL